MTELYKTYATHFARAYQLPDLATAMADPSRFVPDNWQQWLPKNKDAALLDFGCGWGNPLMGLYALGYRSLYGVDHSQEMCELARRSLPREVSIEHAPEIRPWLADHACSFDTIVMNNVIEHLPLDQIVDTMSHIREALVPGGFVFVSTPNMAALFGAYTRYIDFTHVIGFTEFSLFQLLDLAGFSDHRIVDYSPTSGFGLVRLTRRLMYRSLHRIVGISPVPTCCESAIDVISYRAAESHKS